MRRSLKMLAMLVSGVTIGFGVFYVARELSPHYYWEAEPRVNAVWALAAEVRERKFGPLPKDMPDAYALISSKDGSDLMPYDAIWTPDEDPVYRIRINRKYGFAISARGSPSWLHEEELQKVFTSGSLTKSLEHNGAGRPR